MEYRYTAIVLKKREVGETDRLYTFYTREAGKIQALAKGVRRSEAKLGSTLETLSLVDLMVVRTRGIGKVSGAVLEESHAGWRGDFSRLSAVLEALVSFDTLVGLEEKDETLFNLLTLFLATGEKLTKDQPVPHIPLLVEAFHFQLFTRLGYGLELTRCTVTSEKLRSGERLALSPSAGGAVMGQAIATMPDALPVSANAIKLLRLFATHPLPSVLRVTVTSRDIDELTRFRRVFFRWITR